MRRETLFSYHYGAMKKKKEDIRIYIYIYIYICADLFSFYPQAYPMSSQDSVGANKKQVACNGICLPNCCISRVIVSCADLL